MKTFDELDLTAVADAVKAYDEFRDYLDANLSKLDDTEAMNAVVQEQRLACAVGVAFADATSDRNVRDTAVRTRPGLRQKGNWLRALLQTRGLYHGLPQPQEAP